MTNAEITLKLNSFAEEDYKKFNKKIVNTKLEMLGVRAPILKNLAADIAKEGGDYLDISEPFSFEEILLYGLVIAKSKLTIDKTFVYLDKVIKKFDNWAHVDMIIAAQKIFRKNQEAVLKHYLHLKDSENEFDKRVFVIILMDYFLDDKYFDISLKYLRGIVGGKYYVDMAIAWALSVMLIKDYQKIKELLQDNTFSVFIHNKTIQKAVDSFRITLAQKQELKLLRIKK